MRRRAQPNDVGMHLHQPIERVAGAMLQRHLDAHDAITSHAFIARSARRARAYWSHLNGECVPTGSKISPLVWKVNTVLL
jgi:hypothetical protein